MAFDVKAYVANVIAERVIVDTFNTIHVGLYQIGVLIINAGILHHGMFIKAQ